MGIHIFIGVSNKLKVKKTVPELDCSVPLRTSNFCTIFPLLICEHYSTLLQKINWFNPRKTVPLLNRQVLDKDDNSIKTNISPLILFLINGIFYCYYKLFLTKLIQNYLYSTKKSKYSSQLSSALSPY